MCVILLSLSGNIFDYYHNEWFYYLMFSLVCEFIPTKYSDEFCIEGDIPVSGNVKPSIHESLQGRVLRNGSHNNVVLKSLFRSCSIIAPQGVCPLKLYNFVKNIKLKCTNGVCVCVRVRVCVRAYK